MVLGFGIPKRRAMSQGRMPLASKESASRLAALDNEHVCYCSNSLCDPLNTWRYFEHIRSPQFTSADLYRMTW